MSCYDLDCFNYSSIPIYSAWAWETQRQATGSPTSIRDFACVSISSSVIGETFVVRIGSMPMQGLDRLGLGFTTNTDLVALRSRYALSVITKTADDDSADQTFWLNFSEDRLRSTPHVDSQR